MAVRRALVIAGGNTQENPAGDVIATGLPYTAQTASASCVPGTWFGFPGGATATLPSATAALVAVGATVQVSWDSGTGGVPVAAQPGEFIATAMGDVASGVMNLLGEVATYQAVAVGKWRVVASQKPGSQLDARYTLATTVSAPPWAASTTYRVGDLVWQAGVLYRRKTAGTSGASFNAAEWDLIGPSSGGGSSGAANPLDSIRPPVGGSYTEGHIQTNASAPAIGTLVLGLLLLPPGTWDAAIARVNNPATGATARAIAYGIDSVTGGLGSLLFETAAVSAAGGGALTVPLASPLVVTGARLPMWVGVVNQGAGASSFWTATSAYGLPRLSSGTVDLGGTNAPASIQVTGVTGAAPATPTYAWQEYGFVIRIGFRRSA